MTLLEQGDTSKNYLLREGDVVFLTGSHKIDLAADLLPLVNAAYQLAKFNQNNGNGQNTQVTQNPQNPQSPQNPQNPSNPTNPNNPNNPNNPSNPDPGCH